MATGSKPVKLREDIGWLRDRGMFRTKIDRDQGSNRRSSSLLAEGMAFWQRRGVAF
jgi:hypothetical protein